MRYDPEKGWMCVVKPTPRAVGTIRRGLIIRPGYRKARKRADTVAPKQGRGMASQPRGYARDYVAQVAADREERRRWRKRIGLTHPQVQAVANRRGGPIPEQLKAQHQYVARVFAHLWEPTPGAHEALMLPMLATLYDLPEDAVRRMAGKAEGPPPAKWVKNHRREERRWRIEEARRTRDAARERIDRAEHEAQLHEPLDKWIKREHAKHDRRKGLDPVAAEPMQRTAAIDGDDVYEVEESTEPDIEPNADDEQTDANLRQAEQALDDWGSHDKR
jgi:hypothetical protein